MESLLPPKKTPQEMKKQRLICLVSIGGKILKLLHYYHCFFYVSGIGLDIFIHLYVSVYALSENICWKKTVFNSMHVIFILTSLRQNRT